MAKINIKDLDPATRAKAEILAEEYGVTLEEFFETIEEAKRDFFKNRLN